MTVAEQEKVRFISRARELQVMLVPPTTEHHPDGTTTPRPGNIAQFVPDESVGGMRGVYETDDPEQVERMRRHAQFGDVFEESEIGAVPVPEPTEELAEVAMLSAAGDVDGLADLFERERNGHSRELVLGTVRSALLRLEGASGGSAGSEDASEG